MLFPDFLLSLFGVMVVEVIPLLVVLILLSRLQANQSCLFVEGGRNLGIQLTEVGHVYREHSPGLRVLVHLQIYIPVRVRIMYENFFDIDSFDLH